MIEESPEAFIARWAEHAAYVQLFPHTEGSPLLEARAGNAVVQLFDSAPAEHFADVSVLDISTKTASLKAKLPMTGWVRFNRVPQAPGLWWAASAHGIRVIEGLCSLASGQRDVVGQ